MEKPASNTYPIHPLLKRRWSPRAFSDRPVEKEKLQSLFEAARWSASSSNEQPWHFMMGLKGDPTWTAIFETLDEGNREWAGNVPMLLLAICRNFYLRHKRPNSYAAYDTGQAVSQLAIEATDLGLFVHQMGGFDPEKARLLFEIPEGYRPLTAIAIGYPGNPDMLPARQKERESAERKRRDPGEFVHTEKFGKSSGLFDRKIT
jgi:nitroreductase